MAPPESEGHTRGSGQTALVSVRQFHGNGLDLRVLLQAILAKLTAYAGLLEAAERSSGVEHVEAVHPNRAGPNAVRNRVSLTNVTRPDGGSQAVHGCIGP